MDETDQSDAGPHSTIEAGRAILTQESFSLLALVDSCVSIVGASADGRDLSIRINMAADLPRFIIGVENRLRQVLLNLLNNAVKFTPTGFVSIGVELDLDYVRTGIVCFEVVDSGIGIPLEKQSALYERFSQVDTSTSREFGGTSLGLDISREIVTIMGGEIGVRSAAERGSKFWFTARLPPSATTSLVVLDDLAMV